MNRPRRPTGQRPPRRGRPGGRGPGEGGPPRRRSPLDFVPPGFKVLGSGIDREALMSYAQPQEMFFLHAATQHIQEAFRRFRGRIEEFWTHHPELLEEARQIDAVLDRIQTRKQSGA